MLKKEMLFNNQSSNKILFEIGDTFGPDTPLVKQPGGNNETCAYASFTIPLTKDTVITCNWFLCSNDNGYYNGDGDEPGFDRKIGYTLTASTSWEKVQQILDAENAAIQIYMYTYAWREGYRDEDDQTSWWVDDPGPWLEKSYTDTYTDVSSYGTNSISKSHSDHDRGRAWEQEFYAIVSVTIISKN